MNNATSLLTLAVLTSLILSTLGCGGLSGPASLQDYDAVVQSALDTIPACKELEELYPQTTHFITHYGMHGTQWMNSEVWLENGVSITVQYEIDISYKKKEITKYHSPIFAVDQYRNIEQFKPGRYSGSIGESNNVSLDQWNAFIKHDGDLSQLGDYDETRELEHWDEFVHAATIGRLILDEEAGN